MSFLRALLAMPETFTGEQLALRWIRVQPTSSGGLPLFVEFVRPLIVRVEPNPKIHRRARSARYWRREGARRAAAAREVFRVSYRCLFGLHHEELGIYFSDRDPRALPEGEALELLIAQATRLFPRPIEEAIADVAAEWPGTDPGNARVRDVLRALADPACPMPLASTITALAYEVGFSEREVHGWRDQVLARIEAARLRLDPPNR